MAETTPIRTVPQVLSQVRQILKDLDPSDKSVLATTWLQLYGEILPHARAKPEILLFALHGMHGIAFDLGINLITAAEWVDEAGLDELDPTTTATGQVLPVLGLTRTVYYRGYAIDIRIDPDGAAWGYVIKADAGEGGVLFEARGGPFPDITTAYRTAAAEAMHAIGGIAD